MQTFHPKTRRFCAPAHLIGAAGAALLLASVAYAGTDPAAAAPIADRTAKFIGKLHVVVVHFPIALLAAGALAEMLSAATGSMRLRDGSKFFVMLGALAAVVAATLGWINADNSNYSDALAETLNLHRWVGTATAAWSLLIVGLMVIAGEQATRGWMLAYRGALLTGAMLVGISGHLGGMLIYGRDYFAW